MKLNTRRNDVYSEVNINDLRPEQQARIIEARLVLRNKRNNDEIKARIEDKRYTKQIEDADKFYASTPIFCILRILLTLAITAMIHLVRNIVNQASTWQRMAQHASLSIKMTVFPLDDNCQWIVHNNTRFRLDKRCLHKKEVSPTKVITTRSASAKTTPRQCWRKQAWQHTRPQQLQGRQQTRQATTTMRTHRSTKKNVHSTESLESSNGWHTQDQTRALQHKS